MNRRMLLRGLAALPIASILNVPKAHSISSTAVSPFQQYELDVYVHGLLAIDLTDPMQQTMNLYMPDVSLTGHQHVYFAGTWTDPCGDTTMLTTNLLKDHEFSLTLANYPSTTGLPAPGNYQQSSIWLSKSKTSTPIAPHKPAGGRHLSMPAPTGLRVAHRACRLDTLQFFVGDATRDNGITMQSLPVIARTYVFSYVSQGAFTATLNDTTSSTTFWKSPDSFTSTSLHIFAEPKDPIQPGEEDLALQAFDLLRDALSPSGGPRLSLFPVPFDVGDFENSESASCQELSLDELASAVGCAKCNGGVQAGQDCPPITNGQARARRLPQAAQRLGRVGGAAGGETANCVVVFVYP